MQIDSTKKILRHEDHDALLKCSADTVAKSGVDDGTTKTSPGTVSKWLKVDIAGTTYYIPAYTSKTS